MKILYKLILISSGLLMSTTPAYAYLDPSTGSVLLQIILGGFAGLAVAGKMYWTQLMSFFRFGKKKDKSGSDS